MRKLLLCLTAAIAVAGCSSESDRPISGKTDAPTPPAKATLATAIDHATGRSGVASLPDHGALLAFDAVQAPSREGATTLYPIRMSEAHALKAAAPGRTIDIATPDGKTLRFAYASHSEDALGNWTWVGNTMDGLSAVITFGKDAVFGQVALPGAAPLQLTTRYGRTWLGVIDSTRARSAHLLRKGQPDVLIPRIAAAAGLTLAGAKAAPAQPGFAVKASAANTVDVLLGYTPGMVTTYGSASGVNTRLTNLVAVTNAAYQRSQVTPRVRLVHTMQVNYTDTNSNETALSALSGYTCNPSCTPTAVPTELQPLRTARDQYGADLVSLVRPLRAPQHGGCGIAWLVGGDRETIDNSYAPFGYSMVSDGQDQDETDGNQYLCYPETLAHELGHNMGQAHNQEDSGNQEGAHTYSYGYRETSTTGFFTIMAYPLANGSQFPISYFSNPNVNDSGTGRVTGTATANNALSLNQAMPLVAQFRAAVVPFPGGVRNDINGDGRSDFVLFNENLFAYWLMNGSTVTNGVVVGGSVSGYQIKYTGDFNGDGRWEPIYQNASGNMWVWFLGTNGTTVTAAEIGTPPSGWSVFATADVNGDGRTDLLLRNGNLLAYWLMNGATVTQGLVVGGSVAGYQATWAGDFNADGRAEIIYQNDAGNMWLWSLGTNGTTVTASEIGTPAAGWSVFSVDDINGDGISDLVLRNGTLLAYWLMNGSTVTNGVVVGGAGGTYVPVRTGDFDGDGRAEVIYENPNRNMWRWVLPPGGGVQSSEIGTPATGWSVLSW